MDKKYIAAYDFGTSGVKAVLVGTDGRVLKYSTAGYPLVTPRSGWAEQDPEAYWNAVCQATKNVLNDAGIKPDAVIGIVFSTMWKGIIPVDADGTPLHNCIIWLDARAEKQAEVLNECLHTDRFCAQDYWARLMWLRDEKPEIYEKAAHILENNSYLKFRATGKMSVDLSNCLVASPKEDLQREYDEIMKATGLDMDKFPPYHMPWDRLAGLTANAAEEMGLCEGTPVFGGCGDIPAIDIGSGSSALGAAHIYLGSSGWLGITADCRRDNVGEVYQSLDNDKEILLYTMQSACMSFDWAIRCFYGTEWKELGGDVYGLVEKEISTVPPGSENLLASPWLHGERPPLSDKARGLYFNICSHHERRHFVSAMQESICYMFRSKLDAYREQTGKDISVLRVVGGGTSSNRWMQAMADILGVTIEVPADSRHTGAIGAAYCALIGLGRCADFEEANKVIRVEKRFEPRVDNKEIYDRQYHLFCGLFPALRDLFTQING